MYHNRIIPCLLLQNQGLVKTRQFKNSRYIGDPINAVKLFNDKEVDELIFLDIRATPDNTKPNFSYLSKITEQSFMPLCYGGGVKTIEDFKELFRIGFEKVAVNTINYYNPNLIKEVSGTFGSQSVIGVIDIKKNLFSQYGVYINGGKKRIQKNPIDYAKWLEANGVGELLLNNISRDGMMNGYDCEIVCRISEAVNIPVIACGGAGSIQDIKQVIQEGQADAAAAGSLFVYWGVNKAVLINYPDKQEIQNIFI